MVKICLIQKDLKDKDFSNSGEKVNFQILKALGESEFEVDAFCVNNFLKRKYKVHKIMELDEEYFYQNSLSIVNKMDYDLTFSTDYYPSDIVYLHQHTIAYNNMIIKSKLDNILLSIFKNKEYKKSLIETQRQKISIRKNKIILTPSTILKNDLINNLQADGQNVYILPPSVEVHKNVRVKTQEKFTFGFIGNDFKDKGGFILLKALRKLSDYDFNLKLIYPYEKIPKYLSYYLKHYNLEDKIEILPYQEDMNDFYKSIDCLLLPSKKESFALSALEAMSKGKIVIISSRCGIKDIIEPDNNGLIFDITQNPVRNLEKILKYVLVNKDDFENMQQKAIYTASVYNFEKFKEELIRIINKYVSDNEEN